MAFSFKVGDKVSRGLADHIRHGTVSQVYKSQPDHMRRTIDLYAVIWDDTKVETMGYMSIGLRFDDGKD